MKPRRCGFALLELLVALSIAGLVAVSIAISVAPVTDRRTDEEIARLGALFRLAQDTARAIGRPVRWQADASGYGFVVAGPAGQESLADALRRRPWSFPVLAVHPDAIDFGREPLLDAVEITVTTPARAVRVAVDAFGAVTPVPLAVSSSTAAQ